jgi:hypothetical protein
VKTRVREVAGRHEREAFWVFCCRAARLASVLVAVVSLGTGALRAQETSLTIYQDGRVLVRRAFPLQVPRGASTLGVDLGARSVDPGTIVALDEGVEVRGASVTAATGQDAALRRALGRDLEFMAGRGDTTPRFIRGTLLSLDPPAVRLEGRVIFALPGTPAFPESLISLAPRVDLGLEAARPQRVLRLAYQVQGLQWRASYALVVPREGGARGAITGLATIENPGGLSFTGAQVQLLAGEVRRAVAPRGVAEGGLVMMRAQAAAAPAAEEAVGETHVYTLPGIVDLAPGESRTVALFPRADVQVEPEYLLRHNAYVWQVRQAQPEQDLHPEIGYLARRPRGTAFGDTPLPAGIVRVLSPDSAGRLQLLGEVQIQHTPAGRELHLSTGTAFDITAQRTQLTFEPHGAREAVSSYRVTIQNAKRDAVTVQVLDEFPGQNEVLSSSVPPERLSSSSVRFPVAVAAGGEATLEYRVRVRW